MCIAAAALPLVAAGVSAAGTMMGGISAMQQGNYQAKVARQNAGMDYEAAATSERTGKQDALSFWRDVGRVKGDQIAAMAANGIDVDFGSGARVQDDTAALAAEDARSLYSNIHERTTGHLIEALNSITAGKAAKHQGRQAMIGSLFQAGSSLMSGFSQQRTLRAKLGGKG